jgi:hypothetical protein
VTGAGARLGDGTPWNLRRGAQRSIDKVDVQGERVRGDLRALQRRGAAMLEEAVSRGRHADVVFELDDGTKLVGGHRAVLCCASKEFDRMFGIGMKEEKEGIVRMRGVGAPAVKALLEWVYLGEWMRVMLCSRCVCLCVEWEGAAMWD